MSRTPLCQKRSKSKQKNVSLRKNNNGFLSLEKMDQLIHTGR